MPTRRHTTWIRYPSQHQQQQQHTSLTQQVGHNLQQHAAGDEDHQEREEDGEQDLGGAITQRNNNIRTSHMDTRTDATTHTQTHRQTPQSSQRQWDAPRDAFATRQRSRTCAAAVVHSNQTTGRTDTMVSSTVAGKSSTPGAMK